MTMSAIALFDIHHALVTEHKLGNDYTDRGSSNFRFNWIHCMWFIDNSSPYAAAAGWIRQN